MEYFLSLYSIFVVVTGLFLIKNRKGIFVIWLNSQRNKLLDTFFKVYTNLGENYLYLVLLVAWWVTRLFPLWSIFIILFIEISIVVSIKRIFTSRMLRPKTYLRGMIPLDLVEGVRTHGLKSFPSGHSATAFSNATFLSLQLDNTWVSIISFFLALLIGISRIYLCQHFLRDVLVGSLIGFSVACLVYLFLLII